MPYMEPQPPEISRTTNSVGANSATSRSQTCDSPSVRYVGFSGIVLVAAEEAPSAGAGEEERMREVENMRWFGSFVEVWVCRRIELVREELTRAATDLRWDVHRSSREEGTASMKTAFARRQARQNMAAGLIARI